MKSIFKTFLAIVAFVIITNIAYSQTPYDDFAPIKEKKEILKLPTSTFKVFNNDTSSQIKFAEFDNEAFTLSFFDSNDLIIGKVILKPTSQKWWTIDPRAAKYSNMSPYNYCANNPVSYVDPNGDTIAWHGSIGVNEMQTMQNSFGSLSGASASFNQLYQNLQNSPTVYTIKIGQTIGGVSGQFNPNDQTITFLSADATSNRPTTLEEFFHAFQFDIKPTEYPNVANSNLEFEAKLYKVLVSQETVGEALPNAETGMQSVTDALMWANTPLTVGSNPQFPDANFSTQNITSPQFNSQFYQPALNNFVNTWRAIPNAPSTYTATPSNDLPMGIIYLQNQLGR